MLDNKLLREALNKITEVLDSMNKTQHQHNKMLLDLYERVAKLEGEKI